MTQQRSGTQCAEWPGCGCGWPGSECGERRLAKEKAELTALRTQLAEAESRALQAVAREAELVGALKEIRAEVREYARDAKKCGLGAYEACETADKIAKRHISSTSPRAKQLLAIEAAARKLINGHGGEFLLEQDLDVGRYADPDARELEAALTTQPVDEENSR